nr:DUF2285 domain-containing protein [Qipengyuania algicida]
MGTTLIYNEGLNSKQPIQHKRWSTVDCRLCADGRHLVGRIGTTRFRLWIPDQSVGPNSVFHIPDDNLALLRSEANLFYLKALRRSPRFRTPNPFSPTPYQRHRLTLLLAIADARRAGASARNIAFSLIFPRNKLLTGAEWKGANEKRQTLRLIGEAKSRIAGGYLQLPGFSAAQLPE